MMPVTPKTLPLDPREVARTQQPVERATMLPPAAFADQAVLEWEIDQIYRGWICVGHITAVDEPGKFLMRELGDDSVVVIGGEDGHPRAFLNVCRHRGARLVEETEGKVRKRLRCPYHAWSYDVQGELRAAPHMDEVEDFDFTCNGLLGVRLAVVGGLVLIDLSGEAPDPDEHVGDLIEHLDRYRFAELERAGERNYEVMANWKGIAENYNECLHCPGVHPELNALSTYMSGEEIDGSGAWCGGSMELTGEGAETMGSDGGHASNRPTIEGLTEADEKLILYFVLFPNALVSLHPDYVMLHTLDPREPGRTDVSCEFFFEERAIEAADFDPSDAISFWDKTNREDWYVCELTQKGVGTRGYTAGRYSLEETDTHEFDGMIARR
ncbi:MAG TPA: aromatic ring-hydroxylating dioxygenase subunit alpha, partial [Solirubrobacterales bacterium]|nr:aromatic ring-hydroxylating dioxygenase subunit alpha [Solirubrobacterales bacterium]